MFTGIALAVVAVLIVREGLNSLCKNSSNIGWLPEVAEGPHPNLCGTSPPFQIAESLAQPVAV
jgi:hypothetical protein